VHTGRVHPGPDLVTARAGALGLSHAFRPVHRFDACGSRRPRHAPTPARPPKLGGVPGGPDQWIDVGAAVAETTVVHSNKEQA